MYGLTVTALLIGVALTSVSAHVTIVSRADWGAREPKTRHRLEQIPAPLVVIHHSDSPGCQDTETCKRYIRGFQEYHMKHNGWDDIGYNFLVGEDGNVYEGRGWDVRGAHARQYNPTSIGICVIGDFMNKEPNAAAMNATQNLISYGVSSGQIKTDYKLVGHRQAVPTDCPGNSFYNRIKTWPNWVENL